MLPKPTNHKIIISSPKRTFNIFSSLEVIMFTISGTVYRWGTKERIPYATVKAYKKGSQAQFVNTDDDGDFALKDLDPGSWNVVVLQEESFPSQKQVVELTEDKTGMDVYLTRLTGHEDEKSGKILFWSLFGMLILLFIVYLGTHLFLPAGKPVSFELWGKGSLRWLEILFWGFAGILVSKIILTGGICVSRPLLKRGLSCILVIFSPPHCWFWLPC
jgi:hypothetical protein